MYQELIDITNNNKKGGQCYIPAQSMYQKLEFYYTTRVNRNQNVAIAVLSQAQASASS